MIYLPPQQVHCVAVAVYHEARGESDRGRSGVAHVVMNRAKKHGMTPCQIIRQPGQFNFKIKAKYGGKDWNRALQTANYPGLDPTGGALYFNHHPFKGLRLTTRIGKHLFYK